MKFRILAFLNEVKVLSNKVKYYWISINFIYTLFPLLDMLIEYQSVRVL